MDPRQKVTSTLLSIVADAGPRLVVYRDARGREPFHTWYVALDLHAAAKVTVALGRVAAGNRSETRPVGTGVLERRIDWGPGYRIYFGVDGTRLVVLLAGGTKKRQQRDITAAQARWQDYKARRNKEETGE